MPDTALVPCRPQAPCAAALALTVGKQPLYWAFTVPSCPEIMVPHRVQLAAAATLVAAALPVIAPAFAQTPTVVDKATDWTTYAHGANSGTVCFAVSQPKEQEPKGARRDPAFMYVTAWPGAGVKGEV